MKIVLQKLIAASGKCSRRQAEELIRAGKVLLNGEEAFLGQRAEAGVDVVEVEGVVLGEAKDFIYLKFNKPAGYVSTTASFPNEQSIFDLVSLDEKLFPVGRLDKDSRGLMLLTNDGDLAQKLSHPRYEHEKIYEARVKFVGKSFGDDREAELAPEKVAKFMEKGLDIGEGDGIARAKKVECLQRGFFRITLTEGKKRQIRRMFMELGFKILDLKRVELSGLKIAGLPEGSWEYLSEAEINDLKRVAR